MNQYRPDYYKRGGMECWDVIRVLTGDAYKAFLFGNVVKYLWRYDDKGGVEDLRKARTYLTMMIEEYRKGETDKE